MGKRFFSALLVSLSCISACWADTALFTNVKVFDGVNDGLKERDVLVEGSLIKRVDRRIDAPEGTTIINGGGRILMPGLIVFCFKFCRQFLKLNDTE